MVLCQLSGKEQTGKVYRPKQTRDGVNSSAVIEEDEEWAVNNRRSGRNQASSSDINRTVSVLGQLQDDRHLGIRPYKNKQKYTASMQMARKLATNQGQSQKTEEKARPSGEQQSHQLNLGKTSWRSKCDPMALETESIAGRHMRAVT